MSQRRKRRSKNAKPQKKALWKFAVAALVVLVIAIVVGYQAVVKFLHSDSFREKISAKVSEEIGVPVSLGKLNWSGLHLENESVSAHSDGAIEALEAKAITLDVDTDYIKRDVWKISDVLVESAELNLDLRKEFTTIDVPKVEKSWIEKRLPEKAELVDAEVLRANANIQTAGGAYVVEGTQVKLSQQDYGYKVELKNGDLALPFPVLTSAQLQQASLRVLDKRIAVDRAEFDVFESGKLEVDGEVDLSGPSTQYSLFGALTGLKCADVINEDWKQRLRGDVQAKFVVKPKEGNEPAFNGDILIKDGELTALPILDTIAAYTVVRDFKRLRFSEFRCNFYRYKELLRLSNIYVHCEGLMRIEGRLDMRGEALNGVFKVGLNPGTLSHIPGAEEKVFMPGKEGMHWATVRIGGTVDAIEEDLTDRLKAAALDRLFEVVGGQQVLRFTNQAVDSLTEIPDVLSEEGVRGVIRDSGDKVIQSGKDMLEAGSNGDITAPIKTGSDIIQSGLGGLFGGSSKPEEKEEE